MLLIALFLVLVLVGLSAIRADFDIRHPTFLMGLAWIATFALMAVPIINYVEVTPATLAYLVLLIVVVMFFAMVGSALPMQRDEKDRRPRGSSVLLAFGWASLATALAYQHSRWGLMTLLTDPELVRSTDSGGTGLLGILVYSPSLCFILLGTLIARQKVLQSKAPSGTWVFLLAVFLYMAIQPERTTILVTMVWTALSIWALTPHPQTPSLRLLTRVVVPAALGFVAAVGFFISVSERTGKVESVNYYRYAVNMPIDDRFIDPYVYLTGSIPAFGTAVERNWQDEKILQINPEKTAILPRRVAQMVTGDGDQITVNAAYARIPFRFNTYTMFYDPLEDYGVLGAVFYFVAVGLLCGAVYRWVTVRPSLFSAYFYGWAVSAIVFGTMTNKFSGPLYWLALGIPLVLRLPALSLKERKLPLGGAAKQS